MKNATLNAARRETSMKRAVLILLFAGALLAFGAAGESTAWAKEKGQISCGDYDLATRELGEYGRGSEALYRINNKTGETWQLERPADPVWVKIKEKT